MRTRREEWSFALADRNSESQELGENGARIFSTTGEVPSMDKLVC